MSSLKNLVNKAKSMNHMGGVPKEEEAEKTAFSFINLPYNIPHRMPEAGQIEAILTATIEDLRTGKKEAKKRLILTAFRLAFSQDARATGVFHPSEISTEEVLCHRKLYFQKGHVKKDATYVNFTADNRMMRLVDLGTLLHLYVQENLERLGVLKDFEVEVDFPEYGIMGKADGAVDFAGLDDLGKFYPLEEMILEVKSINEFGFKSLRKAKPEHIRQASIYGGLLGYERIVFVYYNKNTSDYKIYVHDVDSAYVENFKELASGLIKRFNANVRSARSADVKKHTDIPTRVCHSRTVDRAMNCPFADYCFKHKCD